MENLLSFFLLKLIDFFFIKKIVLHLIQMLHCQFQMQLPILKARRNDQIQYY